MATKNQILGQHARMWPREVFYRIIPKEKHRQPKTGKRQQRLMFRTIELLKEPGVYVLYQDGVPYYIGQAKRLRGRLWRHACVPDSRYYNFWNHFSAFVVEDPIEMRLKPSLLQQCQQRTVRNRKSKKSRCLWALEK